MYIPWRGTRTLPQGCAFFFLTDPPLFLYSFHSLICCWWCSVANLCPPLCNPMDCNTPGFSVFYHLLELAKTHVHWVGDAIQPSHPLLSPSPPAFSLSQQRAWICCLEMREGQGCWMKLISYKQVEVEGRKAFMPRRAWWGPVQFHKHTEEHTQKRSYSFQLKIIAMRWQCKTHYFIFKKLNPSCISSRWNKLRLPAQMTWNFLLILVEKT